MKLDSLLLRIECEQKSKHLMDTLSLASKISTQRSFKSLIKVVKDLLPKYFGFESVGILLLDMKSHNLFTVSDSTTDEIGLDEEFSANDTVISFPNNLGISGSVFQNEANNKVS